MVELKNLPTSETPLVATVYTSNTRFERPQHFQQDKILQSLQPVVSDHRSMMDLL